MTSTPTFKERLLARETLVGTFLKTPSAIVAEVLGLSDLDLVCIDIEHAPFGRMEADACIGALRAAQMPSIVRVPSDSPHDIRYALDSGATGILVPHVKTAAQAKAIVKAAYFGEGGRGYAGSPRAAGYGTKKMPDYTAEAGSATTVIVQIEDLAALKNVAQIAAVKGVDAIFIGRADLAVAMQESALSQKVIDTVQGICAQALEAGTPVGMFTPKLDEIDDWRARGASLFLLSSDHAFMISGANALAANVKG